MVRFKEALDQAAIALGAGWFGAVDIEAVRPRLLEHVERYSDWVSRGFAGEMGYLVRPDALERRARPELVLQDAKSVYCLAFPYRRNPRGCADPALGPRVARYLGGPIGHEGKDYHDVLAALCQKVVAGAAEVTGESLRWKICVDTSAVLERFWAWACGLGWIGKNTLLVHPKEGSYFFIAVIFLDRELGVNPAPVASLCGNCNQCIKSCPSGALSEQGLDSRKCISYLTLEKRGDFAAGDSVKNWIAGCDLCQEACPFNFKPARGHEGFLDEVTWKQLETEDEASYLKRTRDTALCRIRYREAQRNLRLATKA